MFTTREEQWERPSDRVYSLRFREGGLGPRRSFGMYRHFRKTMGVLIWGPLGIVLANS